MSNSKTSWVGACRLVARRGSVGLDSKSTVCLQYKPPSFPQKLNVFTEAKRIEIQFENQKVALAHG